jgi:hypothetical protein
VKLEITFIKITNSEEHLLYLYKSLKNRKFNVSNIKTPSFDEHKNFVLKHPYRVWTIIKISQKLVGTIYIQKDNSIGIHVDKNCSQYIPKILKKVFQTWNPLPPIKSVRSSKFLINVASEDYSTARTLEKFGAKKIQTTYRFD